MKLVTLATDGSGRVPHSTPSGSHLLINDEHVIITVAHYTSGLVMFSPQNVGTPISTVQIT